MLMLGLEFGKDYYLGAHPIYGILPPDKREDIVATYVGKGEDRNAVFLMTREGMPVLRFTASGAPCSTWKTPAGEVVGAMIPDGVRMTGSLRGREAQFARALLQRREITLDQFAEDKGYPHGNLPLFRNNRI
ncbi:MAG: hypothetical protein ABIA93_03505 [Candidatus Woesearchaeota archaeon]